MRIFAIALATGAAMTTAAMAQEYDYASGNASSFVFYNQLYGHRGHITANGRCNGVSYGTGARSCGTVTGGPSGGLSGRS